MKKSGILNAKLMEALTTLGHTDRIIISDAGFPIPAHVRIVDLSLVAGIPSFPQTLKAVLNEIAVEEYCVFDSMEAKNPEYFRLVTELLCKQTAQALSFRQFVEESKTVKLIIRTGELVPCSNIMLTSASGVPRMLEKYDVVCGDVN